MLPVLPDHYVIQLDNGLLCTLMGGATAVVAGERVNYDCAPQVASASHPATFGKVAVGWPRWDEASKHYVIPVGSTHAGSQGHDFWPRPEETLPTVVVSVSEVMISDARCNPGLGTPYPMPSVGPAQVYAQCWEWLFNNDPTMTPVP
jgi:hypothetical protein